MVEANHPDVYSCAALQDGRSPAMVTGVSQLAPNALCNLAGGETSLSGLAVVPSRELVVSVLSAAGFDCTPVVLAPATGYPPEDTATYTTPRSFKTLPAR